MERPPYGIEGAELLEQGAGYNVNLHGQDRRAEPLGIEGAELHIKDPMMRPFAGLRSRPRQATGSSEGMHGSSEGPEGGAGPILPVF